MTFGDVSEQEWVHTRSTVSPSRSRRRPHRRHTRRSRFREHLFDHGGGRSARDFGSLGDRSDGCFTRGFEPIPKSDLLRVRDCAVVAVVDDVEYVDGRVGVVGELQTLVDGGQNAVTSVGWNQNTEYLKCSAKVNDAIRKCPSSVVLRSPSVNRG